MLCKRLSAYELFDPVETIIHQDSTRFHAKQIVLHLNFLFPDT
jgi:hypothetical protein